MKIVFFEIEQWECEILQRLCCAHEIIFTKDVLDEKTAHLYKDVDIISPFIHSTLDQNVLAQFKQLKCIATRSTGFDHIDLNYCNENGILVSNVPVYGDHTVAEHVFALLLSISHKMPEAINRTRRGDFSQKGLRGFDLQGKTLGVVGTGNIGKRVVEIAQGFRMKVLAYDLNPDTAFAEQNHMRYVDLNSLLEGSDCITLHVPGSETTNHFLSTLEFSRMKAAIPAVRLKWQDYYHLKFIFRKLESPSSTNG